MEILTVVVRDVDDSVPGIRSISLQKPDQSVLPSFTPGSHIVVDCGSVSNAYSLTGDSVFPQMYTFSVLRVADGSGGSQWIHDHVRVGDELTIRAPRSAFAPIQRAAKHLFIGAGIGITPLVSHVRSAVQWNRDFELLYVCRSGRGAYVEELARLAGDHLKLFEQRESFVQAVPEVLQTQPIGTHLYVCGPAVFMDTVCELASEFGWPESRVHLEHFGIEAHDPGEPFEVSVQQTGNRFEVPSGVSLLEALEKQGYEVPNLCRQGVCGECRISVTSGKVLHRDLYLSDDEKAAGDALMCCVSRAVEGHLEVSI